MKKTTKFEAPKDEVKINKAYLNTNLAEVEG